MRRNLEERQAAMRDRSMNREVQEHLKRLARRDRKRTADRERAARKRVEAKGRRVIPVPEILCGWCKGPVPRSDNPTMRAYRRKRIREGKENFCSEPCSRHWLIWKHDQERYGPRPRKPVAA